MYIIILPSKSLYHNTHNLNKLSNYTSNITLGNILLFYVVHLAVMLSVSANRQARVNKG